jgi:hypothetical protein
VLQELSPPPADEAPIGPPPLLLLLTKADPFSALQSLLTSDGTDTLLGEFCSIQWWDINHLAFHNKSFHGN